MCYSLSNMLEATCTCTCEVFTTDTRLRMRQPAPHAWCVVHRAARLKYFCVLARVAVAVARYRPSLSTRDPPALDSAAPLART